MPVEDVLRVSSDFQAKAFMNLERFLKRNVLIEIGALPHIGQDLGVPDREGRRISERGQIEVRVHCWVVGIVISTTVSGLDRNAQEAVSPNRSETWDALARAHSDDAAGLICVYGG